VEGAPAVEKLPTPPDGDGRRAELANAEPRRRRINPNGVPDGFGGRLTLPGGTAPGGRSGDRSVVRYRMSIASP
jgi:hypothetical protein